MEGPSPPTAEPGVQIREPDAPDILERVASAPRAQPPAARRTGPPAPPGLPTARSQPQPPGPDSPPPGVPTTVSTYLDYLPGIYRESLFLGRFLLIFEHVLSPIDRTVENIPEYFNPYLTPVECLSWLGGWLGLVMEERLTEAARRELIGRAAELFEWRGTRRGLREFLKICTGLEPEITQPTVSEVAASRNQAFRFAVRIQVPRGMDVSEQLVDRIVELEKPAFAAYALEIVRE